MAEFADEEILEMAIAREVDANRFYLALAGRTEDPAMQKVFEGLAAEELEHKAKLELELMKSGLVVDTDRMPTGLRDEQDDYSGPQLDIDYKSMLLMAMEKEEASFRLYVDLAGMVSDPNAKGTFVALAEEEVKHKLRFQAEYDSVVKAK